MADRLKETSRFAGWRYAVWVFIKAQLSSYVASLVDFLVTILLVKLSGLFYLRLGISCGRLQKDACGAEISFCMGR